LSVPNLQKKKVKLDKKKTNGLKETQHIPDSNLGPLVWKAGIVTFVPFKKTYPERAKNTKHFSLTSNLLMNIQIRLQ